ncbi:MAG TPA: GNAT family N-acetyltransferase [Microvirga sp.]|nr:GNAT family N-acetyltransferase [Microvirga sp.]
MTARIRPAVEGDVPALQHLERDAAELFREWGIWSPAHAGVRSARDHAAGRTGGHSWVALDEAGIPCGFALCCLADGHLHLLELAVARSRQGGGIGTALLAVAIDHARWRFDPCITLTTDRLLPWNAPFYARHGFVALEGARLTGDLATLLDDDFATGFEPDRWIAMAKVL